MVRLVAAGALIAFFVVILVIVLASSNGGGGSSATTTAPTTTRRTATHPVRTPKPPANPRIRLGAVGAYDPEGDGHENDDLAPLAVDGDMTTFWKTEHYHSFAKTGVGLVLDAHKVRPIARVAVSTDTAGASAEIQVGNNPNGPFHLVTDAEPLTGTTNYKLTKGTRARFVVVWVTALPAGAGEAHVNEVRAFGPTR